MIGRHERSHDLAVACELEALEVAKEVLHNFFFWRCTCSGCRHDNSEAVFCWAVGEVCRHSRSFRGDENIVGELTNAIRRSCEEHVGGPSGIHGGASTSTIGGNGGLYERARGVFVRPLAFEGGIQGGRGRPSTSATSAGVTVGIRDGTCGCRGRYLFALISWMRLTAVLLGHAFSSRGRRC